MWSYCIVLQHCSTIPSRQSSSLCPLVLPHCLPLDGFPCFSLFSFSSPFPSDPNTLPIPFTFSFYPHTSLQTHFSAFSLFISALSFLPSLLSLPLCLSSFTEGLCASFPSLCCSRAFISAAGAPLAGCQSLLVQKPAHSSNTIHCTCIRIQPIITARPSD